MKIKGKEIKEYYNVCPGNWVPRNTILDLEKDLKESLDNLVFTLQTKAYAAHKKRETPIMEHYVREGYYLRANTYLDAVEEINRVFGTNYSDNAENIIKHFENKTPAKD